MGNKNDSPKGAVLDKRAKRSILLGALILVTLMLVFTALQPLFLPSLLSAPRNTSLGILGPNETISGYPTSVVANQHFLLYGRIVNQEGTSQYYNVLIKLGNASTRISNLISSNAPIIAEYYYLLSNNQTLTFPLNLAISQSGLNQTLIFELWSYKSVDSGWQFEYTGIFDQLWLNVTAS